MRTTFRLVLAVAMAIAAAEARGAPAGRAAYVLRIDGADVYLDLGRGAGASPGARVRVLRRISALRPGTRERVEDEFSLGEMIIGEAGEVLSRARPDAELARRLRVGDRVELASALAALPAPATGATRAPAKGAAAAPVTAGLSVAGRACPEPGRTAEAEAFRTAWMAGQELPREERARHWEAFLASYPSSAVAPALRREIGILSQQEPGGAPRARPPAPVAAPTVSGPSRAFDGDPVELVLSFPASSPAPLPVAAQLNWRPAYGDVYAPVSFEREGTIWRARIPAGAHAPGLEYWVGVVDETGQETPVAGRGDEPLVVPVRVPPGANVAPLRTERSRTGFWMDVVDWNKGRGNDYHWTFEGEYLYRVLDQTVHSIRLGFGVYQGKGQSLATAIEDERLGAPYRAQAVGYNYAFTELDFRQSENFGLIVKGLAGINRAGFGTGIEGKIRIGRDPGTHLVLGTGFTDKIGNRNEITLAWDRVTGWPMSATVLVTNEPVLEDYGVRFVYQLGRTLLDRFDLAARLSYELRDTQHAGFGMGVAGTFHW